MAEDSRGPDRIDWLEASGIRHILRALGFAVQPAKLGLALAALILLLLFGGLLDWIWSARGGVDDSAITQFIVSRQAGQPYEEPTGEQGIFAVWRAHEARCIVGLLRWFVPGVSPTTNLPAGTSAALSLYRQPVDFVTGALYGVWWLFRQHVFFFLVFGIGALFLWALAGGAICRLAAVQFARDETLSFAQGLRFAAENLLGGFVLAPCIPLTLALITMVLLVLGGVLLRIPWLGDLIGGLAFFLALFGGFVIAVLLIGSLVGGSLFWPAVAAESQDAHDSFSGGLRYAFSKPWKTVLYAVIAMVLAGVCWLIVNLVATMTLRITHAVVGFGTSPFGWWSRGAEGETLSKLDLLWVSASPGALYIWPDWERLTVSEYFSASMIGIYVLLVVALTWSFLASLYFSSSTVIYFLLRHDVDGTDLEDVHLDESGGNEVGPQTPTAAQSAESKPAEPAAMPVGGPASSSTAVFEEPSSPAPEPPLPAESSDSPDAEPPVD